MQIEPKYSLISIVVQRERGKYPSLSPKNAFLVQKLIVFEENAVDSQ
jgi:hypothetical protein